MLPTSTLGNRRSDFTHPSTVQKPSTRFLLISKSDSLYALTMANIDYLLHETSVGYALFQVVHQADVVGNRSRAVRDAMTDLSKFGKMVKVISFAPFQ